jgi:hypothetical protein
MRRRECGIVRDGGAPTTAPAAARSRLGPWGRRFRKRRTLRTKPAGWCGGRRAGKRSPPAAAQAAVFPGAMCRHPLRARRRGFTSAGLMALAYWPRVSRPPTAVGKNCHPTGVAAEQAQKHRARSAGHRPESRHDYHFGQPRDREAPRCAGPLRPGVPRALIFSGARRRRGRIPRRHKNRECGALANLSPHGEERR